MKYDELKAALFKIEGGLHQGKTNRFRNPDGPAAIAAIEELEANLKTRDDFLVNKGLFMEFVETLPHVKAALKAKDGE